MEFLYQVDSPGHTVKKFLKMQGVSRRLLAKIKYDGGSILVNQVEQNAIYKLQVGDEVKILTPNERLNPELLAQDLDLDICFEDDHYLMINKPAGILSITGPMNPDSSMSNYVAGYIKRQHYPNQKVHIITRLDRDTSGLMVFAKHSFAHSILVANRENFVKKYFALIPADETFPDQGVIEAPIGREVGSIIKREVREDGQKAKTSYRKILTRDGITQVDVQLHTGRTHQIRVHFAYMGYPLLGDDLYGGSLDLINRQALHCHQITFVHPFTHKQVLVESLMPEDMARLLGRGQS